MNAPSPTLARRIALAAAVCFALALWPVRARAQDEAPKPPKSISIQAHVIMASKAKLPHVEDSLKEVAGLLQKNLAGLFNRFRLHRTVSGEIKLEKSDTLALIDKYYLKVAYRGATWDAEKKEQKFQVTYTLVKRTQVVVDGVTKDKDEEIQPVMYTVAPGLFVLIAGPKVNEETLVLAVRIVK